MALLQLSYNFQKNVNYRSLIDNNPSWDKQMSGKKIHFIEYFTMLKENGGSYESHKLLKLFGSWIQITYRHVVSLLL